MAPKRKMEITVVDENERVLFSSFQNVATNLCQMYNLASENQKLAFEAGQRFSLVKMHEWVAAKLQEGKLLTMPVILGYLQDKLNGPITGCAEQLCSRSDQNGASASHAVLTTPSPSARQGIGYSDMHMGMNSDVNME